ncbi:unnamed protein product [Dicrocoelium dendriticum]|nr:unnamed protein product [Dicrocoelium dendriticum]
METIFGCLFDADVSPSKAFVEPFSSLDMWGTCTQRNLRKLRVLELCESANVDAFVYGGTALAVYRECGKMIEHDTDIDLATLEYDSKGVGSFTKLLYTCENEGILCHGVHPDYSTSWIEESKLRLDFASSITGSSWFGRSGDRFTEIPYSGQDCKRIKFFLTECGLRSACDELRLKSSLFHKVLSDPSVLHVDLFTLSDHPLYSGSHLRVNWNIPGVYDCVRKRFPVHCIFPTQSAAFEGVSVKAPADLELYLTIEYGYLGRDAVYDYARQEYIKHSLSIL